MRNRMMVLAVMCLLVLAYAAPSAAKGGSFPPSPPCPPQPTEKKIFVTSETYTGNLGGLAGADNHCQALATAAKIKGTYKAWLSAYPAYEHSASVRLQHSKVQYVDTCSPSHVIADDWTSLTSGVLKYPITCDEAHHPIPRDEPTGFVWTASDTAGQGPDIFFQADGKYACGDWTLEDNNHQATFGIIGQADYLWTGAVVQSNTLYTEYSCGDPLHLYCVEQ